MHEQVLQFKGGSRHDQNRHNRRSRQNRQNRHGRLLVLYFVFVEQAKEGKAWDQPVLVLLGPRHPVHWRSKKISMPKRRSKTSIPKKDISIPTKTVTLCPGKSTLWTNTGQDRNFQRTLSAIGPYQFRRKFMWTNHWSIPFPGEIRMDQWS